ncbi:MAG: sugar phosphate isomerase/epimerase, partial [Christiangramia sp.]|nr:sugar phosphate isomerase/epimerase [Christiangramia sp.]
MQRRKFIKQSGLGLAAVSFGPRLFTVFNTEQPLGIQLYSLRENIKADVEGTLSKIAKIGFKEIETFGYSLKNNFWGMDVKEFKKLLDKYELNSPSGHYNLGTFLRPGGTIDDFQYILEVAKMLDQGYIIIPSIPKELRGNIDDYKRVSEKMNQAG